jgi:hypothetical protein
LNGQAPEPRPPAGAEGTITTTVRRRVKPGHEAAYEEFLKGIMSAASHYPGYVGSEVFRPSATGGEYQSSTASTRRTLCAAGSTRPSTRHGSSAPSRTCSGRCERASSPGLRAGSRCRSARACRRRRRTRWRCSPGPRSFPLITLVVWVVNPLLEGVALVPRLAITTALTVPLMTWGGDAAGDEAPAGLAVSAGRVRSRRLGPP